MGKRWDEGQGEDEVDAGGGLKWVCSKKDQ